ncbi:MAG TPA: hypothetical protein VH762_15330 [Gemmatimonadaceae bacterium]
MRQHDFDTTGMSRRAFRPSDVFDPDTDARQRQGVLTQLKADATPEILARWVVECHVMTADVQRSLARR